MRFLLTFLLLLICFVSFSIDFTDTPFTIDPDTTEIPDKVVIRKITFKGNKVTKERIIERELLFHENDTIISDELSNTLQQSRKNLVNTSLFNFVTIDSIPVEGTIDQIDVNIEFVERWYIWPVPIFEFADRNFNEWLKKKDWTRLNYGMFLTWNNFRGRREKLILFTRFGYDQKYELAYVIPYINRKQTWGMGFAGGLSQNHEIAYNSIDNKEVYYKSETEHPRQEIFAYVEAYHRKGIHNVNWFKLGYNDLQLTDSVLILNPDYSFDNAAINKYLSFFYMYKSDYRDYKQYPLNGHYFDVIVDKKGLGVFNEQKVNTLSIQANFRRYYNLKGRLYYGGGLTGKVSPVTDQPYYYQRGLGYGRDYVRGYEYYVVDGQHFGILKNNLKFELVPMHEQTFGFIPWEQFNKLYYAFYVNLFVDLGYAIDTRDIDTNPLANQILVGYGIGIDFVTYYDFVVRFEYSFNKKGESGFFIHFMPSI
ncbi:MAG: hypothetical protein B6D61_11755 [Bacteroidetes bacterium 4484_249]|nr:MAG: hypothetical protein B6D61_11755 [Bacteroidetes bacterium 4484_249]